MIATTCKPRAVSWQGAVTHGSLGTRRPTARVVAPTCSAWAYAHVEGAGTTAPHALPGTRGSISWLPHLSVLVMTALSAITLSIARFLFTICRPHVNTHEHTCTHSVEFSVSLELSFGDVSLKPRSKCPSLPQSLEHCPDASELPHGKMMPEINEQVRQFNKQFHSTYQCRYSSKRFANMSLIFIMTL